jgi:hypothetical protein
MENKYYTPEKGDLRLGYEYEEFLPAWGKWESKQITELCNDRDGMGGFAQAEFLIDSYPEWIRVQSLTKEKIEAQGWEYIGGQMISNGEHIFVKRINKDSITNETLYKYDLIIRYNLTTKFLVIENDGDYNLNYDCYFKGECKSINDFRYICSLLKI